MENQKPYKNVDFFCCHVNLQVFKSFLNDWQLNDIKLALLASKKLLIICNTNCLFSFDDNFKSFPFHCHPQLRPVSHSLAVIAFCPLRLLKTTQHWSFLCLVTQEGQKDWITAGMCRGTSVLNISTSLYLHSDSKDIPAIREI